MIMDLAGSGVMLTNYQTTIPPPRPRNSAKGNPTARLPHVKAILYVHGTEVAITLGLRDFVRLVSRQGLGSHIADSYQ